MISRGDDLSGSILDVSDIGVFGVNNLSFTLSPTDYIVYRTYVKILNEFGGVIANSQFDVFFFDLPDTNE